MAGWAPLVRAQVPPVPAPSITLGEVIEAAGHASPLVAAARARGAAATEAVGEAGRWPNPVVEVRSENWASGVPGGMPLDTFATVTQTIELGGKRHARRGLAEAAQSEAFAAAGLTTASAQRDAAVRFLDAVRLRDEARALAGQQEALAEIVRVLQRRVEEGLAPESELARVETERTRLSAALVRARLAARRSMAPLSMLLPGGLADPDALVRPAIVPVPDGEIQELAASAPARHPGVVSARARLEAAERNLRFEEARGVPDLAINGGVKRTSEANTGVIALTMPIPLFDRNKAAATIARGGVRAAELELERVTNLAAAEAAAALEAARDLHAAAQDLRTRLVAPAELARAAARSAFEQGEIDLFRLVDAERACVDALLAANDLEIDAVQAAIDARLALGEPPLP